MSDPNQNQQSQSSKGDSSKPTSGPHADDEQKKRTDASQGGQEIDISLDVNGDEASDEKNGHVGGERPVSDEESRDEEEPLEAVIVDHDGEDGIEDEFLEVLPEPIYETEASQTDSPDTDTSMLQQFQTQLQEKTEEAQSNFERLVRLQAEFENFKKRIYKEKQEFKKFCLENIILELLPNIDNLERGLKSAETTKDTESIIEGIRMIHRNMSNSLTKFGLKEIDTTDKIFNPAEHEAMMIVDSTEHRNNAIIEEFQKGYRLNERVIRPSLVSVAKHVAAVEDENVEPEDQIQEAMKEITSKFKLDGLIQDDSSDTGLKNDDQANGNNDASE